MKEYGQEIPILSLHDYFAGQALVGILTRGNCELNEKSIAKFCYKMGNAMLAEREKTGSA